MTSVQTLVGRKRYSPDGFGTSSALVSVMINTLEIVYPYGKIEHTVCKTKAGAKRAKIRRQKEYGANVSGYWYDANGTKHIIWG